MKHAAVALVAGSIIIAVTTLAVSEGSWGAEGVASRIEANPLEVVHRFKNNVYPTRGLVRASDGAYYGATYNAGGKFGYGSVFRVTLDSFATVHSFDGTDGYGIGGPLTQGTDGYLYGVADRGGTFSGGTAYRLTLDGKFRVLYSFGDPSRNASPARTPQTRVIEGPDGAFYGTTLLGGGKYGGDYGAIFRLTRQGKFSVLHYFRDNEDDPKSKREGRYPSSGLVLGADGSFYGCTSQGGPQLGGTVYRLAADGTFTVLHPFEGVQGNTYCWGDLLLDGTNLFGTTWSGGEYNGGTLFRVAISGADFEVLHSFAPYTGDGFSPMGGMVKAPDGTLYGTTYEGGELWYPGGTLFSYTASDGLVLQYSFGTDYDLHLHGGSQVNGGLVLADDGSLYGTTVSGLSGGTVFRFHP